MSKFVSVVIPTYKRNELLERCLSALCAQDYDPQSYEIIVVDDANDEGTRNLIHYWMENWEKDWLANVEEAGIQHQSERKGQTGVLANHEGKTQVGPVDLPEIRYIAAPVHKGPGAARNLGWQAASGEVVAFTDDDCIPWPNWIRMGVEQMVDGVAGVSGQVLVPIPIIPTDYEQDATGLERSDFVTANCFYRKDVLAKVGGFDERFTMAWREDSDLLFTLMDREFDLRHAPTAIVVHPVRAAPWGISLQQQRKAQFNALIYKKHKELYRKYIQKNPPYQFYLMTGLALIAVISFLMGSTGLGITAAITWMNLVAILSVSRLKNTSHRISHILEIVVTSMLIPFLSVFWRIWGAIRFNILFI